MAGRRARRALPRRLRARRRTTYPPARSPPSVRSRCWRPRSPGLISLAVAANVLHLLPTSTSEALDVAEELIATIDATAAGSLHRCHLALQSDGESRGYEPDEWLPLAYEQAADWLEHASPAADPPPLIEHAQQTGRFAALAIGSLDRDAPTRARGDHRLPRAPPIRLRVRRYRRPLPTERLAIP